MTDAMKREGPVLCQFPTGEDFDVGWPESPVWFHPVCGQRADDLHEPGKRSQGADITDPAMVIPLCREHHRWTHEHPAEAARPISLPNLPGASPRVKRGICRVFGHQRSMRIRRDGERWKCKRCVKPEDWTALRAQFREAWWQSLGLSKRKEN